MLRVHRQFIVLRYTASHADSGKRSRAETLYRVALESANLIKVGLVTTAAMLAVCLLALVGTTNTAEADDSRQYNGKIAFSHTRFSNDIYTMNPDGTGLTNLTSETSTSVIQSSSAAWSPDGAKIAFSSTLNSKSPLNSYDIYIMDADGSNPRRLTNNEYEYPLLVGSWSPDGTKIVYTCMRIGWKGYEICRVDSDGSNHIRLTNSGNSEDPVWSPNGAKIAYSKIAYYGPSGGIHTINPDGSNQTLAIAGGGEPDWSPDGTKIVYSRIPPG